ncbi:methyltransferase type 11 [Nocardioides sp. Root122]|uniref:class I SAM-dependent methyltransferase n=1 Tax=Nocardioides TaxID=1839 RepID=UPI0007024F13|nr:MULTISPECIES: class I SAM-dependent methyltransferase [Nocardioides]KQV69904.1 methyltransferase type 11 [Nocardioides sp. Root122]MCK9822860.1 class I SAM-dependent methyltransferase [Nocardioides cavernae]
MSLRLWDERVVPRLTDLSLRGTEVGELREVACAGLTGRVLEIGFGSGLNVRWYPGEVTGVTAIEPSDLAWQLSERRRARTGLPVERAGLDGQRLDLADGSHDSALVTFSLCTIPDALRALREVRRVVRDGGTLHVLEHGLAPDEPVRRWQRRLEPVQRAIAGGCHLTRDVPALVAEAGWHVRELQQEYLPGPAASRPWTFGYRLRAD